MEKYIAILKNYKDFLQFMHWNTGKDYASHLLFERLMGEIDDLLDRLVEVYMGIYDERMDFKKFISNDKTDIIDVRQYIRDAKAEFEKLMMTMPESEQNVIVDILEMFDRHLYLL